MVISADLTKITIKFPFNARADWLKQRALSEKKAWVDDGKLAFTFCFAILTNLTKIKHALGLRQKPWKQAYKHNDLFVCSKHGCTETIVNNRSVKSVKTAPA